MSEHQRSIPSALEFVPWRDLQKTLPELFPTVHSLQWFIRRHQAELARGYGIVHITGRLFGHPERFPELVIEIGSRSAPRRASVDKIEDVL